ncbi:alpha/beta hydrolase [Actinobaculum sp. 313]|uniref:alpha/beta hydrolase n=1 Tax=Actinobaculum sp. 313 TaxID=2495645 RepID=UPI000D526E75|nr:alpha/beta hydrolase [Actinobaculum sp. 313]AWE41471.1 hypothetical protein DDD63_00360 [Actinobaculum sp. 313]
MIRTVMPLDDVVGASARAHKPATSLPGAPGTAASVEILSWDRELVSKSGTPQWPGGRPMVVVIPGGSYQYCSPREADPVALRFLAAGYNVAVLRYRVGADSRYPLPLRDLAAALVVIRENAEELGTDPERIVLCGFSAGGHLAATFASTVAADWAGVGAGRGGEGAGRGECDAAHTSGPVRSSREVDIGGGELVQTRRIVPADPSDSTTGWTAELASADRVHTQGGLAAHLGILGVILGYPVVDFHALEEYYQHSDGLESTSGRVGAMLADYRPEADPAVLAGPHTPPTFIFTTGTDEIIPAVHTMNYARRLADYGVPVELHVYSSGLHGLSVADATACVEEDYPARVGGWIEAALAWVSELFSLR